jgi:hypothetical protein
MPVLRKTINLTVSGNTLLATDSVTSLSTSDAGVQGEDEAVLFNVTVPTDWQDLSVRLKVMSQDGGYDLSDLPVANVITMPLRQGLTMASGRLTVSLIGSTTAGVRKSVDCKTLIVAASAQEIDPINHIYPYLVRHITGSGGAFVTQTDNETYNVDVTGTGGDMLQANYAKGTGQANANKTDHALYADSAGAATSATAGSTLETVIVAKMPTATYAAGTGHANTNKADHAIASDTADAAYAGSALASGWNSITQTLAYASADAPTFTATTSADLTGIISVGMKIMLTNTTVKYFIVTAITSSTITLYGGTDYALTNVAISAVYYSPHKSPFGFPLGPAKWTVIFTDTSLKTQVSPVGAQYYYSFASFNLLVPIGQWDLSFNVNVQENLSAAGPTEVHVMLSTSASSPSDSDLKASFQLYGINVGGTLAKSKKLLLAAKTVYYLDTYMSATGTNLYFRGDYETTTLKAVCAYL